MGSLGEKGAEAAMLPVAGEAELEAWRALHVAHCTAGSSARHVGHCMRISIH